MEDIEKPHTEKYKEIVNDWNYDISCMLISLSLGFGKFQPLGFCCTECTRHQEEKGGKKSDRKDCVRIENTRNFLSIDLHKTETMLVRK